jgi:hypothetical protein
VIDLILKVIRAVLKSLYLLFEGMPALDALRRWFGLDEKGGEHGAALLVAGAAIVLGAVAFVFFLWLVRRDAFGGRTAAGRLTAPEEGPEAGRPS